MDNNESSKLVSYLTFRLGEEEFAAHVSKVLNILEMTQINKMPKTPDYMKGIIDLRGMVLPVIDARNKLGLNESPYTTSTCIIVLDFELDGSLLYVGAIVDEVLEVIEIEENDINPPPSIGRKYNTEFLTGIAKKEEKFIMLLDVEKIFSHTEISHLRQVS